MPAPAKPSTLSQLAPKIDVVEEIRGKFLVKDRDTKFFKEITKAEQSKTAKDINDTKNSNENKRREVLESLKADQYMILEILGQRPEAMVGMLSASAGTAIESLQQRVCQARRRYDQLSYDTSRRQKFLDELDFKTASLIHYEQHFMDAEQAERFRRLQNDLDKAKIKYDAARNITTKYEALRDLVKSENRWYPSRLVMLSELLDVATSELKDLQEMNTKANALATNSNKELGAMEEKCYESRRTRDQRLSETRKGAENKDTLTDKQEKRVQKPLFDFSAKDKRNKLMAAKVAQQEKILTLKETLEQLKTALKASNIEDALTSLTKHQEIRSRLNDKKREILGRRDLFREEIQRLNGKLDYQTFHGFSESDKLLDVVEERRGKLQEAQQLRQQAADVRSSREKLLADIQTGIATLFEKMKGIKLKPPAFNFSKGDPVEDLLTIERKLSLLDDQMKNEKSVENYKLLENKRLFDFLLAKQPAESFRVDVTPYQAADDFQIDADPDNETYLRSEDIKRIGREIIEQHLRPKKKVQKKRRTMYGQRPSSPN